MVLLSKKWFGIEPIFRSDEPPRHRGLRTAARLPGPRSVLVCVRGPRSQPASPPPARFVDRVLVRARARAVPGVPRVGASRGVLSADRAVSYAGGPGVLWAGVAGDGLECAGDRSGAGLAGAVALVQRGALGLLYAAEQGAARGGDAGRGGLS